MKPYDWNKLKNARLKHERGIGFESVIDAIQLGNLLDTLNHPNPKKYPRQKVYIVEINEYVYSVPFIETETTYFLKTIYPSRKYTKKYLKGRSK